MTPKVILVTGARAPVALHMARVHDKLAFIAVACDLGLSTPDTTLITAKLGLSSLASCASDLVLNPNGRALQLMF